MTRTFSKVYGLGGLRVGYAVAAPEVVEALLVLREAFDTNSVAQAAAAAALDDREHVRRTLELNRVERPRLAAALASGASACCRASPTSCVRLRAPGRELFRDLLAHGVIVRPLRPYGMASWLRVSVGTAEENDGFSRRWTPPARSSGA